MNKELAALIAAATATLVLAGCATGVRGSPRRICADAGYRPGTPEFTSCWHGVRDRMFAVEAPAMATGIAAGIIANAPPPAVPVPAAPAVSPSFGTLKREYVSGMNRICVYDTVRGAYTMTVQSFDLCPVALR